MAVDLPNSLEHARFQPALLASCEHSCYPAVVRLFLGLCMGRAEGELPYCDVAMFEHLLAEGRTPGCALRLSVCPYPLI